MLCAITVKLGDNMCLSCRFVRLLLNGSTQRAALVCSCVSKDAASVGLIQLHKLKQRTLLHCCSPLCLECCLG